jgi:nicotinate-nucleotide adenylyltransferase
MRIGLYFGSFNPVHIGHLIIASYVVDNTDLDQVWFVVSPQNPLKPSSSLLNEYHRIHLVQLAIENDSRLQVSDIEFKLPKPSFTIDTITYLAEKKPQHQYSIIMGSDSWLNIEKWKNYELLLKKVPIIIYERPEFKVGKVENAASQKVTVLQAPILSISSTMIRKNIVDGKSINYLVTEKVREEIERNNYYKI